MESYDNGFTSQSIGDWILANKKLHRILTKIEKSTDSFEKQAELIFQKVPSLFGLPKYPDDVDEDKIINGVLINNSLYEELAFLKYLEPEIEKLPVNILAAIFFMTNGAKTDLNFVLDKYVSEGGNKNEISGLGYMNEGIKVELIFVKKGESWFDLGCKYFTKEINI